MASVRVWTKCMAVNIMSRVSLRIAKLIKAKLSTMFLPWRRKATTNLCWVPISDQFYNFLKMAIPFIISLHVKFTNSRLISFNAMLNRVCNSARFNYSITLFVKMTFLSMTVTSTNLVVLITCLTCSRISLVILLLIVNVPLSSLTNSSITFMKNKSLNIFFDSKNSPCSEQDK